MPRTIFPSAAHAQPLAPQDCLTAKTLSEAYSAHPLDGAASGFVLASLPVGEVLWVQDRLSRLEYGAPFALGVGRSLLRLDLTRAVDVLAGMEEGLRTPLAAVVGEIHGDPAALGFTATRRLALRAEQAGCPCWLIRHAAQANGSAARNRWRLASLPSSLHPDDPSAPGQPRWQAELFRARGRPPGRWEVRHDRTSDRLHFLALACDLELEPPAARLA